MISNTVFLLKQFTVETEQGTQRKIYTNYIVTIRGYQFLFHLCQEILRSVDTIFLLKSPVLTKISYKVSSIAKTCIKQKTRITLRQGTFLQKNHKNYVLKATER